MKKTVQPIICQILSRGLWYAPHEVSDELRRNGYAGSYDAVTSRMRDLRKPQYGRHYLKKQKRQGTTYYEYRIESQQEKAA